MTISRAGRVWSLVAAQAASRGERASAADACAAAVAATAVTGAWLTTAGHGTSGHLIRVSDALAELLAELELTLGEGPSLDTAESGGPALASDLETAEVARRWPAFAPAALRAGAAAVFVFPLRLGAIQAGTLGLYRDRPGALTASQLGDALIFADAATLLLLDAEARWAGGRPGNGSSGMTRSGPGGQPAELGLHRAEIDQATGMLTEQLGVGIAEAFVRLRAYAFAHDLRLADVAGDIVARRLRLHPDSGQSGDDDQ